MLTALLAATSDVGSWDSGGTFIAGPILLIAIVIAALWQSA